MAHSKCYAVCESKCFVETLPRNTIENQFDSLQKNKESRPSFVSVGWSGAGRYGVIDHANNNPDLNSKIIRNTGGASVTVTAVIRDITDYSVVDLYFLVNGVSTMKKCTVSGTHADADITTINAGESKQIQYIGYVKG
jgi:hypothetical protein